MRPATARHDANNILREEDINSSGQTREREREGDWPPFPTIIANSNIEILLFIIQPNSTYFLKNIPSQVKSGEFSLRRQVLFDTLLLGKAIV